MTVTRKQTLNFCSLVGVILALGYTCFHAISTLGGYLDRAVNVTARKMDICGDIRAGLQEMIQDARRTQISYVVSRMDGGNRVGSSVATCSACHEGSAVETSTVALGTAAARVRQRINDLRPMLSDPATQKALHTVESGVDELLSLDREYIRYADANQFENAHSVLRDKMIQAFDETDTAAKRITEAERESMRLMGNDARASVSRTTWIAYVLMLVSCGVGALVFFVIAKIGRLLQDLAQQLERGSEQVASAASQISMVSQELAQGASEQASSLEETSATSEEISATSQQNAANAQRSAAVVTEVEERFAAARQRLNQLMDAMREIKTSSDKISNLIKVSDEIAFHTNILALNAAVEAARAGEAGAGFAVVADEVRNLAQRSAVAARETATLIEDSIEKSNQGMVKLASVAEAIGAIAESTKSVRVMTEQVQASSTEQARGTEQIAGAIAQMQSVTQQSAANAEQAATASEELSSQSQSLKEMVRRLSEAVGTEDRTNGYGNLPLRSVKAPRSAMMPA